MFAAWLVFAAGSAPAQTVAPGAEHERVFGPLRVRVSVGRNRESPRVTLTLNGAFVGQTVLTPQRPAYRFSVVSDGASAEGTLSVTFAAAPDLSSVGGSFAVRSAQGTMRFAGQLETWESSKNGAAAAVVAEPITFDLTPELEARTTVVGSAKNGAQVEIYDGTILIASVAMTQASPVAVISHDVILGSARIVSGATFTLTIPTPLQKGQVILEARFQSQGTPLTSFSAAIATWTW